MTRCLALFFLVICTCGCRDGDIASPLPPDSKTPSHQKPGHLEVYVDDDGAILVNGKQVKLKDLSHSVGGRTPKISITSFVTGQRISAIVETLRRSGVTEIVLDFEAEGEPEPE